MKEVTEIAAKYAAEKTNEMMVNAIAKAYADGYRDGYNDKAEEIPVDLRENMTEYVDLGLPSGTLWAKDYEKEEGDIIMYLPYGKASRLNIPTEEQWNELRNLCRWEFEINSLIIENLHKAKCVGPNGNILEFKITGKKNIDKKSDGCEVFFWLLNNKEDNDKYAIRMCKYHNQIGQTNKEKCFEGYKLPIRLVLTRKTNT